ncbi:integral membrane protein S linking to the trans Golgi network-domain-containing protein [Crassisporium funariophilum]|nr:integral membrane protein S linking to the trans Golgi network-domain-containing protein [Crassisporium funariophilum]
MAPSKTTLSNWDPVLLVSQIVSMQTLHYLTLSIIIPPLLATFADPTSLAYEGGAANIGMIMDWREMAGRPTVRGMQSGEMWWAWSGGKKIGYGWQEDQWNGRIDPMRGWIIAACWILACSADIYYIYKLIRRPRLILDFALTLVFNHLVLTTYYSSSLPTSLFFWLVLLGGATLTIIIAEQLCVKREMSEGLSVMSVRPEDQHVEEMEMGGLLPRID